jgi:phosphoribosyl-ATP pyrophosphohydrolase/phosphoribosyl-AMP cyclohydrolase/histidinol dehydrogenase
MTFPLLPLVASPSDISAISEFSLVGQILFPLKNVTVSKHFLNQFPKHVAVLVDATEETLEIDQAVGLLNAGIKTLFINESQVQKLINEGGLPAVRFGVKVAVVSDELLATDVSLILTSQISNEELSRISNHGNRSLYYQNDAITQELAQESARAGIFPIIPTTQLTSQKDSDKISIAKIFISTLTTDRPDGLFTTLITTPASTALGVVYSSEASIEAAIAEKVGVYQSRKRTHELWYKGKTSGATQELVKLEKDCDSDVVKFVVNPKDGFGFCHVETNFTCFQDGELKDETYGSGLTKLDNTLVKRLATAPEGSYTKRLFEDDKLLIAKLKEELDELIEAGQAGDKSEVAWEAADLFYFAMVWCIKNGVRLEDVEKNLDIKSSKVTRRKGDAKAQYFEKTEAKEEPKSEPEVTEAIIPETALYKMHTINAADESNSALVAQALTRPVQKTADIMKLVLPIIELVKKDGDKALLELTAKFDGVTLSTPVLNAPFAPELMQISDDMKEAIDISISNIEKFHAAQLPKEKVMTVETCPGVRCSRFAKPIENVGLYVPGGTAVLPSTAMMLGVPAKVAGCTNIIFASPPARETGKLTPEVVYVAHKLGAKCILMAGGAQAVTAMAYGTDSVLKCDKILGPGNQFVTAAKMYVQNDTQALCSIDMPAGPSEVLVVADENADADFVASDLLSQAEHGVDSQVILVGVGLSEKKLAEFDAAIKKQAEVLPRKDIVAKCLAHSYTLLVDSYDEAFKMSNRYAPEHLILQIDDAPKYVPDYIENAGSIFVGALSPESCGDYSSGTNHTLPTYGYARQYSGVNTATFQKFITAQDVTEEGLKSIGKAVMTLAAVEGLEAHRNAVQVRMDKLGLH